MATERTNRAASTPMRIMVAIAACLIVSGPGRARDQGGAEGDGRADVGAVLEAHCRAREGLGSLRARFTQTRVYAVFDEREESAGEFAFLRPGMIRWRFTSPDSSMTVIRADSAWTILPHIRQIQSTRLSGSSTDRIMSLVGFGSCGGRLADEFEIALAGDGGPLIVLDLVPVADEIAPYFARIELGLDPGDFLPRRIVFHEHSGDLLIFEFSDLRPQAPVPRAEFDLVVPDGYELIRY